MNDRSQINRVDPRRKLGKWGEDLAASYLESSGYRILARNWRCRCGEIDLVVGDEEAIAFVEVKTRRGRDFGIPEEGLTAAKARRIKKLALQYLMQHDMQDVDWRIDLVAVELDQTGKLLRCEHIPNVVLGW